MTLRSSLRAQAGPAPTTVTERSDAPAREADEQLDAALPEGEVEVRDGPFTDRVRLSGLRFRDGERPAVQGHMLNVTDVSELLSMQVRADFYDGEGRLVASGTRTWDHGHEFHDEPLDFTVRASEAAGDAVAAVLSIPDLVNE